MGEKITGIIRRPANVEERAQNCDAVIAKLQDGVLGTDLKHISGARITQGNLQDMYDLLEILSALGEVDFRDSDQDARVAGQDTEDVSPVWGEAESLEL